MARTGNDARQEAERKPAEQGNTGAASLIQGSLPVFVLIVLPLVYGFDETTAVFACEVAAAGYTLAALLGLIPVADAASGWRGSADPDPLVRWFWRLTALWAVFVGLSVVTSENSAASYPVFLKLLALLLLAMSAGWSGRGQAWFRGMILSAGVAGWLHGVLGVVEYLEGAPMPATWADPALRGLIRTRCAGLFTDPNVFGAFLASLLPWQLAGIATPPRERPEAAQAFFAGSLLVTGTALLMTFSRGAYLAGIAGVVLSAILWNISLRGSWRFGGKLVGLVGVVLLLIFVAGPFKYRFISIANTKDMTFSQRTLINRGIYAAAAGVPLTGYGLHTFSQVYPRFRRVGGDYPMNAHNEFYQIFIEAGPGAALLLGLLSICLGWALVRLWRNSDADSVWAGGAAAGSVAVFFLHNLSGFSARMLPTAAFLALVTGSLLATASRRDKAGEPPSAPGSWRLPVALALTVYLLAAAGAARHQFELAAVATELGSGELRTAQARLAVLEAAHPADPVVQSLAARAAEAAGEIPLALVHLDRGIAANPMEALFHAEKARLLDQAASPAAALEALRHAIELDPASEQYRLEAARRLVSLGKPREALAELDAALRTSPGFHDVYRTYLKVEELRAELLRTLPPEPSTATGTGLR